MDKDQAREKFRQADRLFNEQQFGPALKVLTELNSAFPNERHILYPMARCLAGLGRNGEAIDLADRIVRQFDYRPATELYKKLKSMKSGGGLAGLESGSDPDLMMAVPSLDSDPVVDLPPGVPTLDSDPVMPLPGMPKFDSDPPPLPKDLDGLVNSSFGSKTAAAPLSPAAAGGSRNAVVFWIALAVVATIGYIWSLAYAIPQFQEYQAAADAAVERGEETPDGSHLLGGTLLIIGASLVTTYVLGCLSGYWSLRVIDALPFGDFGDNMKDIAIYTLFCFLLWFIVLIGWIFIPIILAKHYGLSFGRTVAVVLLWVVFNALLWIPAYIAAFVVGGMAAT